MDQVPFPQIFSNEHPDLPAQGIALGVPSILEIELGSQAEKEFTWDHETEVKSALGAQLRTRNSPAVRLLTFHIQEPLPGNVLPEMAADHGPDEAARRYRAIVLTTLRQLRGLSEARIRLTAAPEDADEAIRFWLLPRLADKWQGDGLVFRSDGWEIDFGGDSAGIHLHAHGEILCPFLGSRWVHAALLGVGRSTAEVIGPATDGGRYFHCHAPDSPPGLQPRILPELPIIRGSGHWEDTMESPLGPALKRAWEEEGND